LLWDPRLCREIIIVLLDDGCRITGKDLSGVRLSPIQNQLHLGWQIFIEIAGKLFVDRDHHYPFLGVNERSDLLFPLEKNDSVKEGGPLKPFHQLEGLRPIIPI